MADLFWKLVLIAKFRDFHCGPLFPTHGDLDLIPGRGTKIPRAEWCGQKIKKKKKYHMDLTKEKMTMWRQIGEGDGKDGDQDWG